MSKAINQHIQSLLKVLPNKPGVYLYYDSNATVIYVGKAKNLKKRVSSYFTKSHYTAKTRILVRKITDIKHIVVETETDALLLENNLIKKYQPRYNVLLKDDKSYPWIVVKNESFPRVFYTRNVVKDGSKYYGPFTSVYLVRTILELFKQLYLLRTCNLNLSESNIKKGKYKVCLEYHIGNCLAPCVGKQEESDYNENINQIHNILKGKIGSVINVIKQKMLAYASKYEFEKAQIFKEKLDLLENYQSKSTVINASISDIDVYSIIDDDKYAYVNYLKLVNGAIIQVHTVEIKKKLNETKEELLPMAIFSIRDKYHSESKEIIVPFKCDYQFNNVKFVVPKRGDKKKLLDLSEKNVKLFRLEKLKHIENTDPNRHANRILNKLQSDLRLTELPVHIECFDNSNIQGTNPVAACVVFKNAKPSSKDYRHFKIKTVVGPDDFASMEEVVYRRYKRLLDENKTLPQLIVIDGGKGQLNSAVKSLEKLNLRGKIAIIGIAKRLEEIYFPQDSVPIYLDKNSESLKLIQNLRNEAHRFGITFHRNLRSQNFAGSELDNIKGIGEKTIELLLSKFKTISKIKQAAQQNKLAGVIGSAKEKLIINYFENI